MPKTSKNRAVSRDVYDDKPDFAMDLFASDKPKKPKKEEENPESVKLRDRLGGDAVSRLQRLKEQMETGEEAKKPGASEQKPVRDNPVNRNRNASSDASQRQGAAIDSDMTFAEMFDPQPEDDVDFESMLKDSKQDWREYK